MENETILAEERDVILKSKQSDGTLVLTNRQILFIPATQAEGFSVVSSSTYVGAGASSIKSTTLYYTDIKNLGDVSQYETSPDFFTIPIVSVTDIKGRKGLLHPTLEIRWNSEDMTVRNALFIQRITGKSKRVNLTDWAVAIEKIKSGVKFYPKLPDYSSIDQDQLAQTIVGALSDLQEKGLYEIQQEIERDYQIGQEIDSDDLQSKCHSLVERRILSVDETGEFYWIRSPIEDIVGH